MPAPRLKQGCCLLSLEWSGKAGCQPEHMAQIQFGLWVTGFERWYFVAHHPLLPSHIVPVEPDLHWQDAFSQHIPEFIYELMVERQMLLDRGVTPAGETK